jgi:hypothetical protein
MTFKIYKVMLVVALVLLTPTIQQPMEHASGGYLADYGNFDHESPSHIFPSDDNHVNQYNSWGHEFQPIHSAFGEPSASSLPASDRGRGRPSGCGSKSKEPLLPPGSERIQEEPPLSLPPLPKARGRPKGSKNKQKMYWRFSDQPAALSDYYISPSVFPTNNGHVDWYQYSASNLGDPYLMHSSELPSTSPAKKMGRPVGGRNRPSTLDLPPPLSEYQDKSISDFLRLKKTGFQVRKDTLPWIEAFGKHPLIQQLEDGHPDSREYASRLLKLYNAEEDESGDDDDHAFMDTTRVAIRKRGESIANRMIQAVKGYMTLHREKFPATYENDVILTLNSNRWMKPSVTGRQTVKSSATVKQQRKKRKPENEDRHANSDSSWGIFAPQHDVAFEPASSSGSASVPDLQRHFSQLSHIEDPSSPSLLDNVAMRGRCDAIFRDLNKAMHADDPPPNPPQSGYGTHYSSPPSLQHYTTGDP